MPSPDPDWIAVDCVTGPLRARAIGPDGAVLAEQRSDARPGAAAARSLAASLAGSRAGGDGLPVVACGLPEAPLRPVPCVPLDSLQTAADGALHLVPGLRQSKPGADLMRGGETLVAGYLAHDPDFDGVLCLPGAQSRWLRISAGEVVSFQTFLTGELIAQIAGLSSLRGAIGTGWDETAFTEALADAISRPDRVAARLFGLQAEAVLAGLSPDAARARLWGMLIGQELAAARPYWLGQQVALVAEGPAATAYGAALAAQGLEAAQADADAALLAGLSAARALLGG